MPRPKVLLLDVMGTLVTEPFPHTLTAFFGLSLEDLLRQMRPSTWIAFEDGRLDEAAYLAGFFRDGRPIDGIGLRAAMRDAYGFIDGVEPLLLELSRSGVPMHALSNYPPWYAMIEERLGLSRFLRWSHVSCLTGVRKPADEAYLGAARDLGVSPGDCLFVDDREENCRAARAVGMPSIEFVDAQSLRRDLVAHGLL